MSTDLIDQIRARVDALPVPPGDLDAVRRSGGRIRRWNGSSRLIARSRSS